MPKHHNLDFLKPIIGNRNEIYKKNRWLISDFDAPDWEFKFGKEGITRISFRITLSDGSSLLDTKNKGLLNTIKYWLLCSTSLDNTTGIAYSDGHARTVTICTATIVDYLLLHQDEYDLVKFGFKSINEDFLITFLSDLSSSSGKEESIYCWNEKLSDYLLKQLEQSDLNKLDELIIKSPHDLYEINIEQLEKNKLTIPLEKIPYIRAWLSMKNLYMFNKHSDYEKDPRLKSIAIEIYKNTLFGRFAVTSKPEILKFKIKCFPKTEHPPVEIRDIEFNNEKRIHSRYFDVYRKALNSIRLLHDRTLNEDGLLPINISVLDKALESKHKTEDSKRFKTLPLDVVFHSLCKAIEFHYGMSEKIISLHRQLLQEIKINGIYDSDLAKDFFKKCKDNSLRCEQWSLYKHANKNNYFSRIRNHNGLSELIRIYYGCVQVVVGAVMARRENELTNLMTGKALDKTRKYLIFKNAKSSKKTNGYRQTMARPIDEIAAEMITTLESFQNNLLEFGYISSTSELFNGISSIDPTKLQHNTSNDYTEIFNSNFNIFCDYFELPLVDGKRFYIRQHQLRRFFAMSFFWRHGLGRLDTLRWFLGHTDCEHVYRYITEACQGEVLNSVKAHYVTENIDKYDDLNHFIKANYNTDDYNVLSTEDLESYVLLLLKKNTIKIEPEFFEDEKGKNYKIIVKIRGQL